MPCKLCTTSPRGDGPLTLAVVQWRSRSLAFALCDTTVPPLGRWARPRSSQANAVEAHPQNTW